MIIIVHLGQFSLSRLHCPSLAAADICVCAAIRRISQAAAFSDVLHALLSPQLPEYNAIYYCYWMFQLFTEKKLVINSVRTKYSHKVERVFLFSGD